MKKIRRLVALLLCIGILALQTPYQAEAKTTLEKIKEATEQKEKTEKDLKEKNDQIDELTGTQNSLKKELKGLNSDLEEIAAHLEDLYSQIADKEEEIRITQDELATARETETNQYISMKKRIQFMYEESDHLYLEIMFSAKSFSDFITLNNYIEELASYDRGKFEEYQETRIMIEDLEAKLQSELVDLEVLKNEAEEEKANVLVVISNTSDKVNQYGNMIDSAEAEALAYEQKLEQEKADLAALKKQYQEELRLSQLSANSVWRDISEVGFDEGDRYLLANLIYCEAGGEPYEGQLAVGAVVINRVLSPVYPQTVSGVIYQKYQFSPAMESSGRLAAALAAGKATASCYRAADAAMSGETNVGSCVYFRTPVEGLNGQQIGGHIFY